MFAFVIPRIVSSERDAATSSRGESDNGDFKPRTGDIYNVAGEQVGSTLGGETAVPSNMSDVEPAENTNAKNAESSSGSAVGGVSQDFFTANESAAKSDET